MHRSPLMAAVATLIVSGSAFAQAPGAHWSSVTTTTSAVPSQRRENPGTASATHMYVFGGKSGNSGGAVMNDLWAFDGLAWTQHNTNGAAGAPPARDKAGIAWDFTNDKLVVFGGDDGTGAGLADIWQWDPQTLLWTDVTPSSGQQPAPRRWTSIAHDPNTSGMLMFGGLDDNGVHLNDTWLFSNGSWGQVGQSGVQPPTRRQHHLVRRPEFSDVLLVAGQDTSLSAPAKWRTNVYSWTGGVWNQIVTSTAPSAVVANDATYDELRQRLILSGGNGISGGSPTGQVSEFDSISNEWTVRFSVAPGDPVLGQVSRHYMAYVPALAKTYKVSGQSPRSGAPPTDTLSYESDVNASVFSVTPGCAGPIGTPALDAVQLPWLGRDFELEVTNTPVGSVTSIFVGVTPISIDLASLGLGSSSCVITTLPFVTLGTTPATNGNPSILAPIPNSIDLVGATLALQALVFNGTNSLVSDKAGATIGIL